MIVIIYCDASLQDSYSKLQYGHRLDRKLINSFVNFSILDCAEECLRTTRCKSVNYYKGAHFCEINYENKSSANDRFLESPRWIYSEKEDWDIGIVSSCSASNCSINEKCKPLPMGKFECVLSDCGIPSQWGMNLSSVGRWEGIGIERFMKFDCYQNCSQSGSRLFVCAPNGQWETDLKCVCASSWIEYQGHYYYLSEKKVKWTDAKLECEKRGSHLVEIGDQEESGWLASTFLVKSSCSTNLFEKCTAWTGGNDVDVEGRYRWSYSNLSITFTAWKEGEPSVGLPTIAEERDCIDLLRTGEWNDRPCSYINSFICWIEYRDNCYYKGKKRVSWTHAKMECAKRCSHLVEIGDQETSDWLASTFLYKSTCPANLFNDCTAWTGGNDVDVEGQYRWSYSNVPITFYAWKVGEPSLGSPKGAEIRDCIDLLRTGKWNDRPCSYLNPFICEMSYGQ
ncbi:macrophage mannose receptor 1-like [Ostrea edulis]|uniref:macrophage mannose receptor 1-like n=1 Tax=Ostrea edulis TaxID=37623 RepID=UPI0024AE8A7E|nr:macrophage mannose receptor 1-like [Ostrea edulis]